MSEGWRISAHGDGRKAWSPRWLIARGELEKKRTPASSRRLGTPVGSFDLPKTTGIKKTTGRRGSPFFLPRPVARRAPRRQSQQSGPIARKAALKRITRQKPRLRYPVLRGVSRVLNGRAGIRTDHASAVERGSKPSSTTSTIIIVGCDRRSRVPAFGAITGAPDFAPVPQRPIYPFRAASWISSALGGVAWFLTLSGVYGVLSYVVAQRTREIAIRMALGATRGTVVRLVLNQTLRVATTGGVVGTALALAVSQVLRAKLLFINPFDSLAYAGGLILVSLAALGAAWLPARRTARIDPTRALRFD